MIFSHVLYQLSYLAQTKNPPEPERREREPVGDHRCYRFSAPARMRGLHVSATVQRTELSIYVSPSRLTWETPPFGGASRAIAGAGFEPATFGL